MLTVFLLLDEYGGPDAIHRCQVLQIEISSCQTQSDGAQEPRPIDEILEEQGIEVDAAVFVFFVHGCSYLKIVTSKLAMETKMDVALTQSEVLCPVSEFLALVLLGLTYRMSFCWR